MISSSPRISIAVKSRLILIERSIPPVVHDRQHEDERDGHRNDRDGEKRREIAAEG